MGNRRKTTARKTINLSIKTIVLTEAGYRCAVPTCRGILALDMHHMLEVVLGGGNSPTNLIALCPTCHALYHRGVILQESIYCYKEMLIALSNAFDRDAIDKLLFLYMLPENLLVISGDGVLHFSRLIAAELVRFSCKANNSWQLVAYVVELTEKGRQLVSAWRSGERSQLEMSLGNIEQTLPMLRQELQGQVQNL